MTSLLILCPYKTAAPIFRSGRRFCYGLFAFFRVPEFRAEFERLFLCSPLLCCRCLPETAQWPVRDPENDTHNTTACEDLLVSFAYTPVAALFISRCREAAWCDHPKQVRLQNQIQNQPSPIPSEETEQKRPVAARKAKHAKSSVRAKVEQKFWVASKSSCVSKKRDTKGSKSREPNSISCSR